MKYFKTWKKIIFEPNNFYEQLPKKIKYKEPTKFALKTITILLGILSAIIFLTITTISGGLIDKAGALGAPLGVLIGGGSIVLTLLIIIIILPLAILLNWGMLHLFALWTHLFVLIFRGKQGYPETFKAISYSLAPAIFNFIPVVNYLAGIYQLVLLGIGIHHRQKLSTGKSVAVVLIPIAIIAIMFLVLFYLSLKTAIGGPS